MVTLLDLYDFYDPDTLTIRTVISGSYINTIVQSQSRCKFTGESLMQIFLDFKQLRSKYLR